MTQKLYIIKWTNLETQAFGFSRRLRSWRSAMDLAMRMEELTSYYKKVGEKSFQIYRGSYELVEAKEIRE